MEIGHRIAIEPASVERQWARPVPPAAGASRLRDWRQEPTARVLRLMALESAWWRSALDWDIRPAWQVLEAGRNAGKLPGFVTLTPAGGLSGWTCFVPHWGTLQVPAFAASGPEATDDLIAALRAAAAASGGLRCAVFASVRHPGLQRSLQAHGFRLGRYRYLHAPLDDARSTHELCEAWPIAEPIGHQLAELYRLAYRDAAYVRVFAPGQTAEEWQDYASGLIAGPGCGRFLPESSFAVRGGSGLAGAVVVTDIGGSTAHVAQVAVAPDARGRGLGRRLVETAMTAAARAGFRGISLFVSADNAPAAALYESLQFRERALFLAGVSA
jgi:ribosomal protein S18 acetylase RimI-like enzyme